jgi:hypothetical protein
VSCLSLAIGEMGITFVESFEVMTTSELNVSFEWAGGMFNAVESSKE